MKNSLFTTLFLTVLFLIPNGAFAEIDHVTQVGNTVVEIQATGSDTEWIPFYHMGEAKELAKFVDSFNEIAYREDLSATEKENALLEAAQKAFDQRSDTFKGLYCVKFSPVIGSENPALKLLIYPQTSFGYRFEISLTPQA